MESKSDYNILGIPLSVIPATITHPIVAGLLGIAVVRSASTNMIL